MITCLRSHLEHRCKERGYSLDEVIACVVSQNGDQWTIDVDHPAYPRAPKPGFESAMHMPKAAAASHPLHGPGTELHALLGRFGLTDSGDCKCKSRVSYMDRMEAERPGWCAENEDEIVGWLRESAAERGLPFLDAAGRVLVRRAIANARRKEQARAKEAQAEGPAAAC